MASADVPPALHSSMDAAASNVADHGVSHRNVKEARELIVRDSHFLRKLV